MSKADPLVKLAALCQPVFGVAYGGWKSSHSMTQLAPSKKGFRVIRLGVRKAASSLLRSLSPDLCSI